jgi:ribosomal-protein-alanine N-acetyltransferase
MRPRPRRAGFVGPAVNAGNAAVTELRTPRLRLRQWVDTDLTPFAALNADPRVMQYLPGTLRPDESDALAAALRAHIAENGFGVWAVEVIDRAPFIGFVGLSSPPFEARFTPAVQVGWRFARAHWGRGYATEAARAAVAFGFEVLGLEEIVSFTSVSNGASRRLMERLGMTHDAQDDFEHPLRAPDDPLRPHALYRLRRPVWLRGVETPAARTRRVAAGRAPRPGVAAHLRLVSD